jgi:hypothetical protein
MEQQRRRGPRVALIALVVVLVAVAITGAVLSGLGQAGTQGGPATSAPTGSQPSASPLPTSGTTDVVDPTVVDRGWVPEPITIDRDLYVRAALAAAGTFDTQLADRDQWVTWLKTWFTPSPLYDDPGDAAEQLAGYLGDLDQLVLLPQATWDDLAADEGRIAAVVSGPIEYLDLPETAAVNVWTATADVVMTYTRRSGDEEFSYQNTVRVSVQVVCAGRSLPTPGSAQRAGDCKVVRYFDEPVG